MNLFKIPTDDVRRVYAHPLLQERSVYATEVDGMLKVFAVYPSGRVKRWIFGVESAFHAIADDERTAASSVIGTAGVISDASTEFCENVHHDFFGGVLRS